MPMSRCRPGCRTRTPSRFRYRRPPAAACCRRPFCRISAAGARLRPKVRCVYGSPGGNRGRPVRRRRRNLVSMPAGHHRCRGVGWVEWPHRCRARTAAQRDGAAEVMRHDVGPLQLPVSVERREELVLNAARHVRVGLGGLPVAEHVEIVDPAPEPEPSCNPPPFHRRERGTMKQDRRRAVAGNN